MNPLVTVLLPHYKHEAYLYDAVKSIINQTYKNWELLILNDDPKSDLSYYKYLDNRIKVYEDGVRSGQGYRLNYGINEAKGEYICIQDADDVSIPERLKLSVDFAKKYNLDMMYSDSIVLKENGKRGYRQSPDWDAKLLIKQNIGGFGSTLIRTEIAKIVHIRNRGYGKDWEWKARLSLITDRIKRLPFPLYYYRSYTSQIRKKFRMTWKRYKVIKQIKRILDENSAYIP